MASNREITTLPGKRLHGSVGTIHLKEENTLDDDGFFSLCGTGFRVGDCYIMTSLSIFRKRIENLIYGIAYDIFEREADCTSIDELQRTLQISNKADCKDQRDVIQMFLNENAGNIPLLLKRLGNRLSEIFKDLQTHIWEKSCVVRFKDDTNKTSDFTMDWRFPFGDVVTNIFIVKILKTSEDQKMPPRLYLAEQYEQMDKMFIVGNTNLTEPTVEVDECKVFRNKRELEEAVTSSFSTISPHDCDTYRDEDFTKAFDRNSGRVTVGTSAKLSLGSVGSPVVYVDEDKYKGHVLVRMVFQEELWVKRIEEKTGKPVTNCESYGGCTTTQIVAELLTEYQMHDLWANLFNLVEIKQQCEKEQDIPIQVYEKKCYQTGFHVVINFGFKRNGSYVDVLKVKHVFEEVLNWEVEVKQDLTKSKFKEFLREIRRRLSNRHFADKYYCFCMTLMSHGNKDGIRLHDGKYVRLDDVISYFKNDKMPSFSGKPKLFLVQACREQGGQSIPLSDDERIVDEPCAKIRSVIGDDSPNTNKLPVDSDIQIVYATASGYRCNRSAGSYKGSWFIHEVVEVFEKNYQKHHLDDMLLMVKNNLASDGAYRKDVDKPQMAVNDSSLRKHFYLC